MKIKTKKLHPLAVINSYAKPGDAAIDLTCVSRDLQLHYIEYGTGLAIEVPEGFVGLLCARSSCTNKGLSLGNGLGIIDSGYRGELKFRFYKNEEFSENYKLGDRIGQLLIIPYPSIELTEVEDLSDTDRSSGGYGSSGS